MSRAEQRKARETWTAQLTQQNSSRTSHVSTVLNVTRVTPSGPIQTKIQVDLPLDTPFEDVAPIIQPFIDLNIPASSFDVTPASLIALNVTTGPSTYTGILKINTGQPLAQYYKNYRRRHRGDPCRQSSSKSSIGTRRRYGRKEAGYSEATVTVGPAKFNFNRTLRVPDNATEYALPPGLGTFPIVKAQDYADLPDFIKQRGGYIMPLFQREALWIDIDGGHCAIKISVGGINAITGGKHNEQPPEGLQDYVVGGKQPWLDGIAIAPGVVRQFVAMKLGHGHTIEEQLSETRKGGIQIDVYPSLVGVVKFCQRTTQHETLDLDKSPAQLGVEVREQIIMSSTEFPLNTLGDLVKYAAPNPVLDVFYRDDPHPIYISVNVDGKSMNFQVERGVTVRELKDKIQKKACTTHDDYRLVYDGEGMDDESFVSDYGVENGDVLDLLYQVRGGGGPVRGSRSKPMGIAAGGMITQKIYQDQHSPVIYDEENAQRVFIHTVSTPLWEQITGVVCPMTPITPALYKAHKFPWYQIYDEHMPTVHPNDAFNSVRSIREVDSKDINPAAPPNCSKHSRRSSECVLRPCDHTVCYECLGKSVITSRCAVCGLNVRQRVGFKSPVPTLELDDSEFRMEMHITGIESGSSDVTTLMLDEDSVSSLHGAVEDSQPPRKRRKVYTYEYDSD
ncbi:hypothetical protein R3P38DRAFT_3390033 [Favolaschia claudopus]|uniref:Ubiquitin-like domain-containing protein n=1 Tax=Favolaschia claudopus TaxID=2862362 RepID=A0AAW0CUJ6_9AGAR